MSRLGLIISRNNTEINPQHTLFAEAAHESSAAGAQSGDVVAVASVPALTHLGTVLAKEAQRTTCQQVRWQIMAVIITSLQDQVSHSATLWHTVWLHLCIYYIDAYAESVWLTYVECSRVRSSLGCTCIRHRRRCSRPRCDSYTYGCSWVPTDQVDKLQRQAPCWEQNIAGYNQATGVQVIMIISDW